MGLLILTQIFNWWGFGFGLIGIIVLLATNKTVNGRRSYLYPIIPFNGKALLTMFVRVKKRGHE